MNENMNKDCEMDYSQKSPNSIRSSKSKKEKLTKFLKEYEMEATDLMEVALELMEDDLEEAKKKSEADPPQHDFEDAPQPKGKWGDWKTFESNAAYAEVTFPHELEDYPDIDLRKAAMVKELDMMNMAGLLDKEDVKELKTMRQEVDTQRSIMESYFERNFNEKKSHNSRH